MRVFLTASENEENRRRVEAMLPLSGNKLINPRAIKRLPLTVEEQKRLEHFLIDCCDEVWLLRDWEAVPRAVEEKSYAELVKKPVKTQSRNWKKFV
ncbi:MAG: DUF4406 domain-containing protein [Bacteroidales bacterium]|nr:DUF4406 domain-containing protein [Bacteroidales bacterium]